MRDAAAPARTGGRSLALASLGLACGLAGVLGYFVLLTSFGDRLPGARNSAVASWLVVGGGLLLSVVAVARATRRTTASLMLLLNVGVAGLFAVFLYVLLALPPAAGPALGARAVDFALRDQTGKTVRLAEFAGTPLLLVFYRGHW